MRLRMASVATNSFDVGHQTGRLTRSKAFKISNTTRICTYCCNEAFVNTSVFPTFLSFFKRRVERDISNATGCEIKPGVQNPHTAEPKIPILVHGMEMRWNWRHAPRTSLLTKCLHWTGSKSTDHHIYLIERDRSEMESIPELAFEDYILDHIQGMFSSQTSASWHKF